MPKVTFLPSQAHIDVPTDTKLLIAARRAKVDIVFGCASCQCGTCGVKVSGQLSNIKENEKALLEKMGLPSDADIRLACQARVCDSEVVVDLSFQNTYNPDQS